MALQGQTTELPSFPFRLAPEDAAAYRSALGVPPGAALFGMALRAATTAPLTEAVRASAQGRHAVHVAQHYRAERKLQAGVDYVCTIRIHQDGESRLRLEQQLRDSTGQLCLVLVSEIALVADKPHATS